MSCCFNCPFIGVCKTCRYVHNKIDVRGLLLYTKLPEIFLIFTQMINFSNVTEQGYSFSGVLDYIKYVDLSDYPVNEFFNVLGALLDAQNIKFRKKINNKK